MYLVDTNVVSEARRGSAEARHWFRSVEADTIFLSVVTLGEIMKGIILKQRSDPRAATSLRRWLDQLRLDYADRILPITDRIAVEWGRLAAERPGGMADGLIAATAFVHEKHLVTRNIGDFEDRNIPIINPWSL
jgi:predicted nucleic acid-binding protein